MVGAWMSSFTLHDFDLLEAVMLISMKTFPRIQADSVMIQRRSLLTSMTTFFTIHPNYCSYSQVELGTFGYLEAV